MSLFRQVWLMIIGSALLAFVAALLVSTLSARDYLQTQLYTQSNDTAAALALSMSQQSGDPAMLELMSSALFDSGHFELLIVRDPHHKVLIELRNKELPSDVPHWFVQAFPIQVQSGQALISNGWKQAGSVEIRAHSKFGYESLWSSAQKLFIWMLLGGIAVGGLMHFVLTRIRKPITQITEQAHAITERRFIALPEPRYIELRPVAAAMNVMVAQVKAMFDEQAARIDQLKKDANRDPVTGLANRSFFMGRLSSLLGGEDSPPEGYLLMLRLHDLGQINRNLGREATDRLLAELAGLLAKQADEHEGWVAARLNGADFALAAPELSDGTALAEQLLAELGALAPSETNLLHLGYSHYSRGETMGELLGRTDAALARAEAHAHNALADAAHQPSQSSKPSAEWRSRLQTAIEQQQFVAHSFPAIDWQGKVLHRELMLRLPDLETDELLSAGVFMPFAARFDLLPAIDLAAIRLALELLAAQPDDVAVNVAPQSMRDSRFRRELVQLLQAETLATRQRLWLEIAEQGLGQDLESLATFAAEMHQLGLKVGIEHFGRQFGSMPRLYDLPLHYLKIDGSFVHEIDQHEGNQHLVKAMVGIASKLGIRTLAELVRTEGEWQQLQALGLHGATGPITQHK
ncbi:EAL domain-containing protein [Chitinibacter sp. ZOR0017]|uniref:bifunctional diguanylate cyclase/phosphodiesterase n=1 Tax=Chitinibacter sp. ZOR0017 TaxID=1339254 RepID=UPI00064560C2|nr:EAL domain-containing protein [Chitinibacter sp. ZOR0017]